MPGSRLAIQIRPPRGRKAFEARTGNPRQSVALDVTISFGLRFFMVHAQCAAGSGDHGTTILVITNIDGKVLVGFDRAERVRRRYRREIAVISRISQWRVRNIRYRADGLANASADGRYFGVSS